MIVTGSSGYLGAAVVTTLAERYRLLGFDRETTPHPPPEAECICIDITDEQSLNAAFERVKTAYGKRLASVIHLAAYFDLSGQPHPAYEAVTIGGTRNLLKQLAGFEVEQFVFISTMLVHAPTRPGKPIDESSPLEPKLPYRESKALTEKLLRGQRGKMPVLILRPAGVYDHGGHSAFLAQQIARLYERRLSAHFYPGDLATGQPFLHLHDLTDAIARSVDRRAELPEQTTLLLGEGEVLGYGELQRELGLLIHGQAWRTISVPSPLARAGTWAEEAIFDEDDFIKPWMVDIADDHYELDLSRARELLDWSPRHGSSAAMPCRAARRRTGRAFRMRPARCSLPRCAA